MIAQPDFHRTTMSQLQHEFRDTWVAFRAKWQRATNRMVLSTDDILMLDRLDGTTPGISPFLASNRRARERLAGRLIKATRQLRASQFNMDWLHVTILLEQWTTGDSYPHLDLDRVTREGTNILNQMSHNWSAVIEFVAFSNRQHVDDGYLISVHVHAVVWGYRIAANAKAKAEEYEGLMRVSTPGIAALHVKPIKNTAADLARVVRYALQGPDRRKTFYIHPRTGRCNLHESEASDRYITYLRMYELLSRVRQRDMMFAAGEGVELQCAALAGVARRLRTEAAEADEIVAMSDVAAFWLDFMPRHRHGKRFGTPRICRPQIFK